MSKENKNKEQIVEKKGADETVSISKTELDAIREQLKMLTEISDKGRLFNYESSHKRETSMKVNVSVISGKYLIGWEPKKDILIKHPTTGLTVGEEQQYELTLLAPDDSQLKVIMNSYSEFSNARYNERVLCNVIGKREARDGKYAFEVQLPDGREILLNSEFVN